MEENPISLRNTGIKYGLITAAICIVYFIIMRIAGFINYPALRFFNYAFLAVGLILAYIEVRHKIHKHRINYLPGLGLGFIIVLITAMAFSVFVFIYSMFIDPNFLNTIASNVPYFSGNMNSYIISVFVFGESMIFGVVLAFLIMQFFKRNSVDGDEKQEEANEMARR
jgi:hypothetical protein